MTENWKEWEAQVVDGQFCLVQYLASSEHSAVFLTKYGDPKSQNAAIKLVPEDSKNSGFQLARWELASKLSHPNLVRLFHFGRCRLNSTRLLYVVMEYAEEDLSQVLPDRPLTGAEAREMLASALDALTYLHAKGFVHGRLKPANIM